MYHHLKNSCLLTDFYQFTMAQAAFDRGREKVESIFNLFFRKNPFKGNWALVAGINDALDFIEGFEFDKESLEFLSTVKNPSGAPIFSREFLAFLGSAKPKITVHGVLEGEILFPFEPILRIEGPLYLCQLLETPLLNLINFQTLIATKAARIVKAANGKKVVDFGLRRAQGFDGALSASKAAFIGGIDATSNVWLGKNLGLPLSGTQAHSFIMSYEHQSDAFFDFARSFKENCILVVDTYDPFLGIKDAIKVFLALKKEGLRPLGIRLDSGPLDELAAMARAALNGAGLNECQIFASGDLDEYEIDRLEKAKAPIDAYGVGTKLITAHDDPALGGVFKLAAVKENKTWRYTFKESADKTKQSWPGPQAIVRSFKDNHFAFDRIIHEHVEQPNNPLSKTERALHLPLWANGKKLLGPTNLFEIRERAALNLSKLPPLVKDIYRAPPYPVYFDDALIKKKQELLNKLIFEDNRESPALN